MGGKKEPAEWMLGACVCLLFGAYGRCTHARSSSWSAWMPPQVLFNPPRASILGIIQANQYVTFLYLDLHGT